MKLAEVIDLLKYLDKTHLIDQVQRLQIPNLKLTNENINGHIIYDEKSNEHISIDKYLAENNLRLDYSRLFYALRTLWIESDFKLTVEDLLKKVDKFFLENYTHKKNKKK